MSLSINALLQRCFLFVLVSSFSAISYASSHVPVVSGSTPLIVDPEFVPSNFRTDTFIPDFFGEGFVTVGSGGTFDFPFNVPAGEEGLYQIQVRHASNNSISILIDGTAITPDLALSTRTLGFWFDNEAYTTLSAGSHVISFGGPVFLDTFRITRTPPDQNRFLTYPTSVNEVFFAGNEENTNAYYNTIDPDSERSTLNDFRELNKFTNNGVDIYDESNPEVTAVQEALNGTDFSHAIYQNIADLDLGRNMFVLKFDNGDVASYVQNFATPDNALDRRNILATVAMEYRADERLTTFYAYGANGRRVTKVDLDGRGEKFVPTLCAACHGGKPKDDINGVYQNGGNIGSKWIAWDLDNYEYSDRLPQAEQESEFRSMNQSVLCTTPSVSNAELVRGWYGADASSNCSNSLPEVDFNGEYVPNGWNDTPEHRELYLDVVRPSCRACHAQRGTYSDNTLLERKRELEFSTFEHFNLYKDEIEDHVFDKATMPSALVSYEAFWRSRGTAKDQPEILDRVLFGGAAHVSAPAEVYSSDAQAIYGARRQPGRPIADAAITTLVTAGVEGRLNALPSEFAATTAWSVTGGEPLANLPNNEPLLTISPAGEHEVTLRVSNFQGSFSDSATVTINTDAEQRPSSVLFDPDIKNMLQSSSSGLSCNSCHQPGGRANTVFHFAEPAEFRGNLTPEQFSYSQALTRVDCRDPESSLLLRRPTNPNHFGGALFREGGPNWTLLRRWIAEGAPFDEERSFIESGSDCGVVITDPDYQPTETQSDSGLRADYPRVIVASDTGDTGSAWVEFADNTKQSVDTACRRQLVDSNAIDERVLDASVINAIPDSATTLSCDAIAALPKQDINSVPTPVQPGLDLEIRPFATIPDNTTFGRLRLKPGLLALARTGGRIFVVEQHEGKIWEVTDGEVAERPWFDVHQSFINETGDGISVQNLFHGGLRGVAFHPEFASNGKFYTSQMRIRPDNREGINYISDAAAINIFTDSTVSEWTVDASGNLVEHRELFRIGYPAEDHLIKQIMFNPTATVGSADYGLLYIAHGDGTLGDFFGSGQVDDALGKILRINPLIDGQNPYSIPASNPFTNDDTWETDEVFAVGFRNPHNLAFAQDGTLMVVDIGRANVEEVNVVTSGGNYGWPDREGSFTHLKEQGGGFLTGIGPLPADDANLGFTYPAAQYGHVGSYGNPFTGHSIAGGFVVENGSALDGQYFFGDFVSFGDVYHTSLQGLQNAVTQGSPSSLTQSITQRARIVFDHDNNPATDAQIFDTMLDVITGSETYFSQSGSRRADIRFGQGPNGEIYLMSKLNNTVYLVTNSVSGNPPTTLAPSIPGNLRQQVYSDTTAELFWDRSTDDGFVRGYEVIRNGELLGVFDALGIFQEGLDPAVTYNYEVTALDFDGNRSTTATLILSTGGSVEPPVSNNLASPVGLRAEVYSASSAELFWSRSDTAGLSYEVRRDGEVVNQTDGVSFFDSSLPGDTSLRYEVIAIDLQGRRSDSAEIVVSTNPNTQPITPPTQNGPSVPENLRHLVYSNTSAEIFWNRSTDNGFVQGYEIIRNGESLGIRDVLGLYEGALDPSVTYTYEIAAVDNEGNRSTITTISFSTTGVTQPPLAEMLASPTGIRAEVYSAGSAELFWDRSQTIGLSYEVRRDGEVVNQTDGVSFFDNSLRADTAYRYEVIAIDRQGNRSTPAGVDVVTNSGTVQNSLAPSSPSNLRHLVYSETVAEIFWNRSSDNGSVQGYEVVRNGVSLGIRDTLGLFEQGLDPAITYTYAVTAIDNEGNRSETATIDLSTR